MKILFAPLLLLLLAPLHAEVFTPSYELELKNKEFVKKMEAMGAKLTEEDRATMKAAMKKISAQVKVPGLKLGQQVPDFKLINPYGKTVSLKDSLTKGPVILVFYRGAWCPYCNLHLKVLKESLPEFKKYGAQLITVTPQKPDKTIEQFKDDGYPFEVLSDPEYQVMKAYNLYFDLPAEVISIYERIGIDVAAHNGEGRFGLPVPASFVLDKSGTIRAVHANTSYWERMEPADIVKSLVEITATN